VVGGQQSIAGFEQARRGNAQADEVGPMAAHRGGLSADEGLAQRQKVIAVDEEVAHEDPVRVRGVSFSVGQF
jgi:hypothetical protein